MTNSPRRMSVTFREADIQAVMANIHAGKSTEIIGLGSVGKSNFVRRLLLRDVQERYLYQAYGEQAHCIFIPLDANSLLEPLPSALHPTEPSGWAGYELIASRLLRSVMENDLVTHISNTADPAHPESLYNLYHRMWPGDNPHQNAHIVAFRYVEDLVTRIMIGSNHPIRLVFIFDEFEKMLDELPARFFQSLRSLRDQYKDRIIYISTVRQIAPLLVPQEEYVDYEPFLELFTDARHFLLPYRPSDADQTFERLGARQHYNPPSAHLREQLLAVTSGHAGLIRAAFSAWAPHNLIHDGMNDREMIETLLTVTPIIDECKTIWRSMSDGERRLLFDMARSRQAAQVFDVRPTQNPMARLLIQKGILLRDDLLGFEHIRPLILAAFIYSILPSQASKSTDNPVPNFPIRPPLE